MYTYIYVYIRTDVWMDGGTDEWMAGWMDGWMGHLDGVRPARWPPLPSAEEEKPDGLGTG